MQTRSITVIISTLAIMMVACNSTDKKADVGENNKGDFFYDYQIVGEEGNDNLQVQARLKNTSEDNEGQPLPSGEAFMLDGKPMEKDSTAVGGTFFEKYMSIDSFAGKHSFSCKTDGQNSNKADFFFAPMRLTKEIGSTVSRKNFNLSLAGLDTLGDLRIVLTDTSYQSEGINELWEVKDSTLTLTEAMLANVKNGPVQLSLTREYEQDIAGKGRILFLYTIRREFVLAD